MSYTKARVRLLMLGLVTLAGLPGAVQAQTQVQITRLSDRNFGTISNFTSDISLRRNVCVYSSAPAARYNVTAVGSGTSGAFTIASGPNTLRYDVQWAGTTGATSGTALSANVVQGGFTTTAANPTCSVAPATTATLLVILRNANVTAATAGAYTGTLRLTIAPN